MEQNLVFSQTSLKSLLCRSWNLLFLSPDIRLRSTSWQTSNCNCWPVFSFSWLFSFYFSEGKLLVLIYPLRACVCVCAWVCERDI